VAGLWSAVAVWVTHAVGAAVLLAAAMLGEAPGIPALDPNRFAGMATSELNRRALSYYRRIYVTS
jgi:hypothetical protein